MDVTVFIRTFNEAELIGRCLEQVFSQKTSLSFEVVVLDSQSSDETQKIVGEFDVSLYEIPKSLFTFSKALNFGVTHATKSRFFVPLSGHCVPLDEHWLETLTAPLVQDDSLAATYSRQIPWPDACPREVKAIKATFPAESRVTSTADIIHGIDTGLEPYQLLIFSNAASCIRRTLLTEHPFLELPFAEDRAFALSCYRRQLSIAYVAESIVYHSHSPNFDDFRKVARSAEVAKHLINVAAKQTFAAASFHTPNATLQLLKTPLSVLYALVMSFLALPMLLTGVKRYIRSVAFYFASIGTTVGKLQAARQLQGDASPLEGANAEKLIEEAKQLR